jgi:hypothetical protein
MAGILTDGQLLDLYKADEITELEAALYEILDAQGAEITDNERHEIVHMTRKSVDEETLSIECCLLDNLSDIA